MNSGKIIMASALALWSILAVSCSGPKEALTQYLDASIKGDHIRAYKLISSTDKSFKDVKTYLAESSAERNNLIRALSDKVSFEIKSVKKQGEQAEVRVEIIGPDYAAIINDLFGGEEGQANNNSEASIKNLVQSAYQNKKIPMTNIEWIYTLVKEEDGWKVFMGWEDKTRQRELIQQASQLEKEQKLYEAKDKYQEVLQLDPENREIQARIQELEQKIAKYEEGQAYAGNVLISNLRVMDSIAGGQGVFMELKNNGTRTLKMVEITIDFLDSAGNVIHQKTYQPIEEARKAYDNSYASLAPGQSRQFGIAAKEAPPEWSKKVNVRVSDLQFEE